MEYKPPERKRPVIGMSNPNDLGSLFGSKPRAKKPSPVPMPTPAHPPQSSPDRSTRIVRPPREETTEGRDQEPGVDATKPESSDQVQLFNQRLLESIKNSDAQLKAGRQQMKAMQEKALEQENERDQIMKDMRRDREELNNLRTQLGSLQTEAANLRSDADQSLRSFNADRRNMEAQISVLGRDLAAEREPRAQQQKRLTRSRGERAVYEQEQRSIEAREKRATTRKTYGSWREYFRKGVVETTVFLNGKAYTRNYAMFGKREVEYWKAAASKFEEFVTDTISCDDRRAWKLGINAREMKLDERAREQAAQRETDHLAHRNKIFSRLAVYLQSCVDQAHLNSREYLLDHKEVEESFSELKVLSHDSRRLTKLVRHNMNMHDGAPIMETRNMFEAALSSQAERTVSQLEHKFDLDLVRALWLRRAEVDVTQVRHLKHQIDALEAIQDALKLSRYYISRHNDLIRADWEVKQPILHQAVWEKADEVLSGHSRQRGRLASVAKYYPKYGLSPTHDILAQGKIMNLRATIEEYQKILFRNAVIKEHHGRLDPREGLRLQTVAKRKYEDTTSRLRRMVRRTKALGLHSWIYDMVKTTQKDRDADFEDLLQRNAAASLPQGKASIAEAADDEHDTLIRFTDSSNPPLRRSERRRIKTEKLEAEKQLAEAKQIAAKNDQSADNDATPAQDSSVTTVASKSTSTAEPDSGLATYSPTEEIEDSEPLELGDNTNEKVPPKSQPRWRAGRQSSRGSGAYGSSLSSSSIRPRRGVFPKPEYKFKPLSRMRFKPTSPRQSAHSFRLEEMPQSSWISDTELPYRPPPSIALTQDGSLSEHQSSVPSRVLSQTGSAAIFNGDEFVAGDNATNQEDHLPLKYQIPPQDLKNALLASKTSGAAFWKYSMYKSPVPGEKITVHYCPRFQGAEEAAKLFLNQRVIGFDIEWESGAKADPSNIKEGVSLIQLACEDRIALFQIATFVGNEELMPPSLKAILQSPDILKVGVNIAGDFTRIRSCFGVVGQGLFELSHLYKVVTYSENEPTKVDRKLVRLAEQVERLLHLPLAKGEVRTSAWSKRLSLEQVEYAANDAYAGFRLFDALEAKRKAMRPTPPRPAFYELRRPLLLGNGEPAPKAPRTRKEGLTKPMDATEGLQNPAGVPAAADQGAKAMAEFEDEEVDQDGAEGQSDDEFYSCDSDAESEDTTSVHQPRNTQGQQKDNLPASPNPTPTPVAPSELIKAEQWLAQWRAGLSPDRARRATPAYMRTYALWHDQSLKLKNIAGLLRQTPLALSTVALYVFEAIQQENLPFEKERLREVLKCIPLAAQWRYKSVISRLGKQ